MLLGHVSFRISFSIISFKPTLLVLLTGLVSGMCCKFEGLDDELLAAHL